VYNNLTREGASNGWKPPQKLHTECRLDQLLKKFQSLASIVDSFVGGSKLKK